MAGDILRTERLSYRYPDGTQALKDVNLTVRRGECVALMGSNGSGKSTLFLTLNGVLKPSEGRVLLDGEPVKYSRRGLLTLRRRVGIVFQEPDNQLFCADVTGEISFGLFNLKLPEEEIRRRVKAIMEEMGITAFADKPTHFLSGGQKKRVSIADILVMDPDLLILDEPAAALDPKHARMVDALIEELKERGITVLISTHNVDAALVWADRVVLMEEGRILADGVPQAIFSDQELLRRTNLEQPAVLAVFDALCLKKMLPEGAPPRTTAELCARIVGRP